MIKRGIHWTVHRPGLSCGMLVRIYDPRIWKQVGGTTESLEASVDYLSIYLSSTEGNIAAELTGGRTAEYLRAAGQHRSVGVGDDNQVWLIAYLKKTVLTAREALR